eukprot:14037644-Alexandrium_andersonii.AAC.1
MCGIASSGTITASTAGWTRVRRLATGACALSARRLRTRARAPGAAPTAARGSSASTSSSARSSWTSGWALHRGRPVRQSARPFV